MNEGLDEREAEELEGLLRRMPLRRPPATMDRRVGRVLRDSPARWRWRAAAAVVLVAGVGVAVLMNRPRQADVASPIAITSTDAGLVGPATRLAATDDKPFSMSRTLAQVVNEGVVGTWGNAPLQRVRHRSVKQSVVIDPATGTHFRISVPQEEIMVMKVQPF
jgi:hypothetical protein